jgi:hypothetical protein
LSIFAFFLLVTGTCLGASLTLGADVAVMPVFLVLEASVSGPGVC